MVSVTTTSRASEGLWLSTKIVHVTGWPARGVVSGLQSFVISRSARSSTIVTSTAWLSAVSGSTAPPLTAEARFVIVVRVANVRHHVGVHGHLDREAARLAGWNVTQLAFEISRTGWQLAARVGIGHIRDLVGDCR